MQVFCSVVRYIYIDFVFIREVITIICHNGLYQTDPFPILSSTLIDAQLRRPTTSALPHLLPSTPRRPSNIRPITPLLLALRIARVSWPPRRPIDIHRIISLLLMLLIAVECPILRTMACLRTLILIRLFARDVVVVF
jgi:hypothetical protein